LGYEGRIADGAAVLWRALDAAPGMRVVVSAVRETEDVLPAQAAYLSAPTEL